MLYLFSSLIIVLYIFLYICARREVFPERRSGPVGIFDQMSMYLMKRKSLRRIWNYLGGRCLHDLETLYPEENIPHKLLLYMTGKLSLSLMVVLTATLLSLGLKISKSSESSLGSDPMLARGDYMDANRTVVLRLKTDRTRELSLTLQARRHSREELEEIYPDFIENLMTCIKAENESLDRVETDLNLVTSLDGYPFRVEWRKDNSSLIGERGQVSNDDLKQPREIYVTAIISSHDFERELDFSIKVYPRSLTEEEIFLRSLSEELERREEESVTEAFVSLPKEHEGVALTWSMPVEDYSFHLWGIGIIVSAALFFLADKDLGDKVEQRKGVMKQSYPDLVYKFALYLGAGMTVRSTFIKIAEEMDQTSSYLAQEMMITCGEMRAGVSEAVAYEHFGKRIGLQEYIRFSTLLQQNLKRGSSNLLPRLREEAEQSGKEKLLYCRKTCEEASTKLLGPMVLLLLVVMIMVMMPAFGAMNF